MVGADIHAGKQNFEVLREHFNKNVNRVNRAWDFHLPSHPLLHDLPP